MNASIRIGKILVVDDDKQVADLVTEYLSSIGYDAVSAYGGSDALDLIQEDEFHLIITDMRMPGMSGLELLESVKAIDRRIIVILITAFSTIDAAVKAIKEGAFDFISKPFDLDALKEIVDRAMEQYGKSGASRIFRRH